MFKLSVFGITAILLIASCGGETGSNNGGDTAVLSQDNLEARVAELEANVASLVARPVKNLTEAEITKLIEDSVSLKNLLAVQASSTITQEERVLNQGARCLTLAVIADTPPVSGEKPFAELAATVADDVMGDRTSQRVDFNNDLNGQPLSSSRELITLPEPIPYLEAALAAIRSSNTSNAIVKSDLLEITNSVAKGEDVLGALERKVRVIKTGDVIVDTQNVIKTALEERITESTEPSSPDKITLTTEEAIELEKNYREGGYKIRFETCMSFISETYTVTPSEFYNEKKSVVNPSQLITDINNAIANNQFSEELASRIGQAYKTWLLLTWGKDIECPTHTGASQEVCQQLRTIVLNCFQKKVVDGWIKN